MFVVSRIETFAAGFAGAPLMGALEPSLNRCSPCPTRCAESSSRNSAPGVLAGFMVIVDARAPAYH